MDEEYKELMLILEDAYWRLKDLSTTDLNEDEEERVDELISGLDTFA
jgi:hypothetical protein